MFTQEEISELSTILDGVIDHIESSTACDELGPSMSYEIVDGSFEIDYTCWGYEEGDSSLGSVSSTIDAAGNTIYTFNIITSGHSCMEGDYEYEENYIFYTLDELITRLLEDYGF